MPRITVPTKASLPHTLRVDSSNKAVVSTLKQLKSREALIDLVLHWLDGAVVRDAIPYLLREGDEDEDDIWPPCRSLDQLRHEYDNMRQQKGSKNEVADRILEYDWRHGLTLYQLATIDFAILEEKPTSKTWSAYDIRPLQQPNKDAGDDEKLKVDKKSLKIPCFRPAMFLAKLQEQVPADVKAHFHFSRPEGLPVTLLRIFVVDSPYNTEKALRGIDQTGTAANYDSSRTIYLAFPDSSPSLFISNSKATGPIALGESRSLRDLIVQGVPKAFSRSHERFKVEATNLSDKNLRALLDKKGSGRTNAAGGGWSIYADQKKKESPFDSVLPSPPLSEVSELDHQGRKRKAPLDLGQRERREAKRRAGGRFGSSAQIGDGKGVERVEVVIQDPFPSAETVEESEEDEEQPTGNRRKSKVNATLQQANQGLEDDADEEAQSSTWTPSLKLSFKGVHVFAGIRQLVEAGIIDGDRMPGWMTGEEGVTTGVVRQGRIRGHKGSGI